MKCPFPLPMRFNKFGLLVDAEGNQVPPTKENLQYFKMAANCHEKLVVVYHNLAKTAAVDMAIKKLSISEDIMDKGIATILREIQRQAKEALAEEKK